MTTNVTVKTHTWAVEITQTDEYQDRSIQQEKIRIEPDSERTVYLTQSRTLHFRELPLGE